MVVGGGIGGLLSAHVLARRFARVTLVERDHYPEQPVPRRGIPQGRCLHMLMAAGQASFERLLPGWGAELTEAGAVAFDYARESALRSAHGWLPRFDSGITLHACSRGLLEWVLRRRVLRDARVRVLEGQTVLGLVAAHDAGQVVGVRIGTKGGSESPLEADLVVVASGLGSPLPLWLTQLGLPPPEQTTLEGDLHYVFQWFAIPESFRGDWKVLALMEQPGGPRRSGLAFEAEGRSWGVVLLGPGGEPPPSTSEEFLQFAAGLADRHLHDAISQARPTSPVLRHGHTRNHLHHYERMARWPERLVALGDAVCALNPYFGLGMTACARGVELLGEHLEAGLGTPGDVGAARRFQQRLAETNDAPWRLVTGCDGDGTPVPMDPYYLECFHRLAPRSQALSQVLMERQHLLTPPDILSTSEVMALVRRELQWVASE